MMRGNGLEIQNLGSTPSFFICYDHDISKVAVMSKDNLQGTVPHVGNVAQIPLGKASGSEVWQAGPMPTDRFSRGESGLHCTWAAMRLAFAKTPSPWIEAANVYLVSLTS